MSEQMPESENEEQSQETPSERYLREVRGIGRSEMLDYVEVYLPDDTGKPPKQ